MQSTPDGTSPNIGVLGITVDSKINRRVKALFDDILSSVYDVQHFLCEAVANNHDAMNLLSDPLSRFTCRVIVPKDQVGRINPFTLSCGLTIGEEARIITESHDIVYIGGNGHKRFNGTELEQEWWLATDYTRPHNKRVDHTEATLQQLTSASDQDIADLLEMYQLCFNSYLVPLNEDFIRAATQNTIFWVARNESNKIVASAAGESLQVGPLTLFEVSEVAAHPLLGIRGAASECVKLVVQQGKTTLPGNVIAFMEARMWRNILGMAYNVGLGNLAGILHQHCLISSPPQFNSIHQTKYGSLAVCYSI